MSFKNLLAKLKNLVDKKEAVPSAGAKAFKVRDPNALVKNKQVQLIAIALAVIIGLAFYLNKGETKKDTDLDQAKAEQMSREAVKKEYGSFLKGSATDEEIWMVTQARKIKELEDENERRRKEQEEREKVLKAGIGEVKEDTLKTLEGAKGTLEAELAELRKMVEQLSEKNQLMQGELEETKAEQERRAIEDRKPIIISNRFFDDNGMSIQDGNGYIDENGNYVPLPSGGEDFCSTGCGDKASSKQEKKEVVFQSFSFIDETVEEEVKEHKEKVNRLNVDSYIPTSTHIPAVMLSGLDAPTGGSAQNNPHPVLLLIDDFASLPNRYQYNFKECRLLAHAWGDISSERAIMRTEAISCVDHDGNILEKEIKAHIFGEDGKPGVRGQVVLRSGQALMRGVLAGVAAGIGSAFNQQAIQYTNNGLGTTSIIEPGKIGMAGIGSGLDKGLNRLADFYMDLVDTIMPVVEVGSQRTVDVVLAQGLDLLVNDAIEAREIQPGRNNTDQDGIIQEAINQAGLIGR